MVAALRALAVLIGHHTRAALDMAGAGLLQASRVGVQESTQRPRRYEHSADPPEPERRAPLSRSESQALPKAA